VPQFRRRVFGSLPRDPTFRTDHEKVKEDSFLPYFKGAIGAIDGSHVPMVVPAEEVVNHTCHNGYTSQNVLVVCDFNTRFILRLLLGRVMHMTCVSSIMHWQIFPSFSRAS
jgi:hypothetical protein